MKTSAFCLAFTVLLGILPSFAMAEDVAKAIVGAGIDASFSEAERQLIRKYFGERDVVYTEDSGSKSKNKKTKGGKGLPPGLAKRDRLPPGLEKHSTLPPGLAKKNLPSDLNRQLPPVPEGYERQIVEDAAIVLVHKTTGRIADVITDAIVGD